MFSYILFQFTTQNLHRNLNKQSILSQKIAHAIASCALFHFLIGVYIGNMALGVCGREGSQCHLEKKYEKGEQKKRRNM